ncbi:uncharacterized protein [Cicer arietinum]|uniref:Uncharacterized protein LOC101498554 n=1 Tax=Cicer arietinum TaxID=3827 RepID=A0A1S2XH39_CICAR|nr:uncharacterized protein LOC101498554 [Cicer arietinum]
MEKQLHEESAMDSFVCPSFSTYSTNNVNDIADQVTQENDTSHSQNDTNQNDNDDFEFVAFRKSSDEIFFDSNRYISATHDGFPIFNRDISGRWNSDAAEIRISFEKLLIGDEKKSGESRDSQSSSSSEVGGDLLAVSPDMYCLWTPKSPAVSPMTSPMASPSKCNKSNSTGSSSNSSSSKRWKFLSLLRRSKSDGKESLIMLNSSLGFKKGEKEKNSKEHSDKSKIPNVAGKQIPVTVKKVPAPLPAIEAYYGRKKETRRKSYLPYKQELVGFGVDFNAFGRSFAFHS